MLTAMDEGIGRILAALDQSPLKDNTLVIFHSDNGGPAPGTVTSNGPLRAGKATLYEGGVRVPAVARWPGKLEAGKTVTAPLHVSDWHPTLMALAGETTPDQTLDGKNAWESIAEGAPSPHKEILLNATPRSGAIIIEPWKLVINGTREHNDGRDPQSGRTVGLDGDEEADSKSEQIELFNLTDDPYEKKNLAADQPEKVRELRKRYDELAAEAVAPKVAPRAKDFVNPAVWGESSGTASTNAADSSTHQLIDATIELTGDGALKLIPAAERDPNQPTPGFALLDGVKFQEGTIEVELKGRNVRQESFLGVAFHVVDAKTFEGVYFRPFNFQAEPPFKTRAVQYISWPDHRWQTLREQHPGKYENGVNPVPDPDGWFRTRIEVDGKTVRAFVNDASEPSLVVERLTDRESGAVGLWVDIAPGEFRNLRVTPK
jgi:hypothetical protein